MRKPSIGRFLAVAAAAAVVLVPGIASAQRVTAAPGWRTVSTVPSPSLLLGVAAADQAQAWAVGWGGSVSAMAPVVRAWNGSHWAAVSLPSGVVSGLGTTPVLDTVTAAASASANAWAFTESGHWLHLAGTTWTGGHFTSPVPQVQSSLAIGPTETWAFGGTVSKSSVSSPFAAVFTAGHGWRRTPVPGKGMIVAASAVSPTDVWAVIGTGALGITSTGSGLLHRSAGKWQAVTSLPAQLRNAELGAVLARSDSNVWVGGAVSNSAHGTTEAVGHWNGTAWTVRTLPAAASAAKFHVVSIVPDGSGGLWALGFSVSKTGNAISSRLWHLTAGRWTGPVEPVLAQRAAALVGLAAAAHSVWGVGDAGVSTQRPDGLIALEGPTP